MLPSLGPFLAEKCCKSQEIVCPRKGGLARKSTSCNEATRSVFVMAGSFGQLEKQMLYRLGELGSYMPRDTMELWQLDRERAECSAITVSKVLSEERTHWVLQQTRWVLVRNSRCGTQIIGSKELTEFAPGTQWTPKTHWARCLKPYSPKPYSARFRLEASGPRPTTKQVTETCKGSRCHRKMDRWAQRGTERPVRGTDGPENRS